MIQTITVDIHSGLFRIFQVSSNYKRRDDKSQDTCPERDKRALLLSIHFYATRRLSWRDRGSLCQSFFIRRNVPVPKVSALTLAFIDGKLLRQRGGEGSALRKRGPY